MNLLAILWHHCRSRWNQILWTTGKDCMLAGCSTIVFFLMCLTVDKYIIMLSVHNTFTHHTFHSYICQLTELRC